jgi:transcriptional regulator with XRE-family HTH domain
MNIREIWKKSGMTQKEFAIMCGVSHRTISSWVIGRLKPGVARSIEIKKRIYNEDTTEKVIATLLANYESDLRTKLKIWHTQKLD